MAKKTKKPAKQIKLEKKIAKLKKQEAKLARAGAILAKRVERERQAMQRQIKALDRRINRLEDIRDNIFGRNLPSQLRSNKAQDRLVKLRNGIREVEHHLKVLLRISVSDPPKAPDSERRPDREAGEEAEE